MSDRVRFSPLELFEALDRAGVEYVVIGGLAATLHGSPLRTNDADISPARTAANADRLAAALAALGAKLRTTAEPFGVDFPLDGAFLLATDTWSLVTTAGNLDIAWEPAGTRGYDDLRAGAVRYELGGLDVLVASLLDVIRSKQAANREKDRQALPTLRRLAEMQGGNPAR